MTILRGCISMFSIALLAVLCVSVKGFVVQTAWGKLQGLVRELDGAGYCLYAGIPYAEAPIGRLRFKAPLARKPWQGVLNATRYGPSCPQNMSNVAAFYPDYVVQIPEEARVMSEDCLSLNVFIPRDCSRPPESALAVMVWIHGGSYATGQGSGYDASALAVRGRVIVVTINYRLNVFGFLSTNDDNAPGNFGLLDQQLALRWVHENIAAFGGDPSRVTLFGQSAGGAAAGLHVFAPNSRRLFHRVGAIGGLSQPGHAIHGSTALYFAKWVGREANCTQPNTTNLINCLRERSTDELLEAGSEVEKQVVLPMIWMPTTDGHFLSYDDQVSSDSQVHHDLTVSVSTGDGSVILEALPRIIPRDLNLSTGITPTQWTLLLRYLWGSSLQREAISFAYGKSTLDDPSRGRAVVDFMTDWNFVVDIPETVDRFSTVRSKFMSVFDHRSRTNPRYAWLQASPHSEDLSYIFGLPYNASGLGYRFTVQETILSNRMITYWSNFAKSGDPNVNPDLNTTAQASNLTYWPEYGDSETYLLIQLNNSTVGQGYRKDKVMFWNDYLPKLASAAREYCFHRPGPGEPPTMSADKPECTPSETFFVESLGLKLTQQQAEKLIKVFIFLTIALLCVMVILCGAVMGYKFKYKGKRAALNGKDGFQPTNGDINKHVAYEVNEGFTTEFEDTKM